MKTLEKLCKKAQWRGLPLKKFKTELQRMQEGYLQRHQAAMTVAGENYVAFESRVLNKHRNQSGPGDWRVLMGEDHYALATHTAGGAYQIQQRLQYE